MVGSVKPSCKINDPKLAKLRFPPSFLFMRFVVNARGNDDAPLAIAGKQYCTSEPESIATNAIKVLCKRTHIRAFRPCIHVFRHITEHASVMSVVFSTYINITLC